MSAQELVAIIVGLVVLLILLFLYWNCRCRSEPTCTPRRPQDREDVEQAPKTLKNDSSRARLEDKEAKTGGGQASKKQNNDPSSSKKKEDKEAKTGGGQAPKKQNNDPSLSKKKEDKEAKTGGGQAPKKQNNDPSPSKKKEDKMNGGQAQDSQWNAPPRSDHGLQTGSSSSGPDNSLTRPRPGIAFTYPTLEKATNQFSRANFLGKGGFGPVHKGVVTIDKKGVLPIDKEGVLPFDIEIAVKQLEFGSQQGDDEFEAEVKIISRVHHRHLVTLFGHCISRKKRLLVYEFVPNKTLHFHLHGEGQPAMELPIRLKIALGTARGLAYLHDDCHPMIIHRDIKAANILLDSKFEAKVADFGLARFAYDHETHVLTSKLKGTFGYFAPEYAASGELSDKSDVYAFGVMLLELITGRVPVDRRPSNNTLPVVLVDWAKPRLKHALEGKYKPLVDPRLPKNYNPNEMARMVACAAACVRHSAKHRPRMSLVVQVLGGVVSPENLNDDVPPVRSGRT